MDEILKKINLWYKILKVCLVLTYKDIIYKLLYKLPSYKASSVYNLQPSVLQLPQLIKRVLHMTYPNNNIQIKTNIKTFIKGHPCVQFAAFCSTTTSANKMCSPYDISK